MGESQLGESEKQREVALGTEGVNGVTDSIAAGNQLATRVCWPEVGIDHPMIRIEPIPVAPDDVKSIRETKIVQPAC